MQVYSQPKPDPTQDSDSSQMPYRHGKIWQNAIQRYYEELEKGGYRGKAIDKDIWNVKDPVELLDQIKSLPSSERWMTDLKKILLTLSDFAAVTALALGMDGRVAAVIWGSIRLVLNLGQPVFPEVVKMLKDLEITLPKYRKFEQQLPMTPALEDALCDVYTDIILFCAQAITFFRNNPNFARSTHIWSHFNQEFLKTISNLQHHSRRVDEEVEIIRMTRESESVETLQAIAGMNIMSPSTTVNLPCHVIPYGLNPQFFHRSTEVAQIRRALDPDSGEDGNELRVLAIHGLGGVGKTQLALHYANTSLDLFDAIAFIPSETRIKLSQAVAVFANKLGLIQDGNDAERDDMQAIFKVKDWLNTSGRRFLLIFDNVEEIDIVLSVWPSSKKGSILILTRSSSIAAKRAAKILHLTSFPPEIGLEALHALTGLHEEDESETKAAVEICHLLSGLPLALVQISQFIRERGYNYEEFLKLYEKSAARILSRGEAPPEYNHTLSTVWEISIANLPPDARALQNLLAFFDSDSVAERLLTNTRAPLTDDFLHFLSDELDFGDAVGSLLKLSLLNRSSSQKTLSLHRLVQTAIFCRLSNKEATSFFNITVQLLSSSFPNTWREKGHQQGHGWQTWETCKEILPHVQRLIELAKKHKLEANSTEFAELIFRAGTYLWEIEQPTIALSFFNFGLSLGIDRSGPMCNPAIRLLGHVALDLSRPKAAVEAYQETLLARLKHSSPDSPAIADVYDSIACAYTEIGDVVKAFEYLDKAKDIHFSNDPNSMARTSAIYAMTYLRAGQPDQALKALQKCWELQGLTEEQIAVSRYPKHSGDIVLLARIYHAQGNTEAALQLASKSITIRKGVLGSKGPRVADSMFLVASILREGGKQALATKLLRDIIDMSEGMVEMRGHMARALWTLGMTGENGEVEELKQKAKEVRHTIQGREAEDEDTDEAFSKLVGWMLW
ncbi:MAG: hypothetical protein M1824_001541 [Vezdaea acicularis]|nr:MAG: hypothetical protein M1824_001541 [Vezdaea acicularis]